MATQEAMKATKNQIYLVESLSNLLTEQRPSPEAVRKFKSELSASSDIDKAFVLSSIRRVTKED